MENWILNVVASNGISTGKLVMDDIEQLKITKIRHDKIYFKYKGMRYFVIANDDCGDKWFSLYKKEKHDGKWNVEQIGSSGWEITNIRNLLDEKSRRKRNVVYSHIDKEFFIKRLKEYNLIK